MGHRHKVRRILVGRILAIDYGAKRCGIAVTDELRLSVNPRPWVAPPELLDFLRAFAKTETLDTVVLTESRRLDGSANAIQERIDGFAERLKKALPEVEVAFQDEAGSSKEATQHLIATGVGRRRRSEKGALDSVSAGIILERYLRDAGIW